MAASYIHVLQIESHAQVYAHTPTDKHTLALTGNHDGFGVSTQTVLEQPGESGVTVRDVSVFLVPTGQTGHFS